MNASTKPYTPTGPGACDEASTPDFTANVGAANTVARLAKHYQPRCRRSESSTSSPAAPPIAAGPSEVGHLEGDLICGSFNRSAIVTVFDRASRHCWLADFPESHNADETLAAVGEILERIPEALRRTLTWDQGREMARHAELATLFGIDVYFAEPHSPWQRPTNENGNGLIRRYVGKGTNLAVYTQTDLRAIENRLNTMPRRSLNWDTAADRYNAAVAMTD